MLARSEPAAELPTGEGASAPLSARLRAWWDGAEVAESGARRRSPIKFPAWAAKYWPRRRGSDSAIDIPTKVRFRAWWEGYDAEEYCNTLNRAQRAPVFDEAAAARRRAAAYEPPKPHTPIRLKSAQLVWGSGFLGPGGNEIVLELVALVGITPAMSVLEVGAGIGGAARALVDQYGIWISCHEDTDDCVRVGNELTKMAGAANRVRLTRYDPETIELGPGAWDCILSRETLYRVRDKERLIDQLRQGLKLNGQLVLTDYVLERPGLDSEAVRDWLDVEEGDPKPWSVEEYEACFKKNKISSGVTPLDLTETYCDLITSGWWNLQKRMTEIKLGSGEARIELLRALEADAALWAKRLAALKSGDVKVRRLYAQKKNIGGW